MPTGASKASSVNRGFLDRKTGELGGPDLQVEDIVVGGEQVFDLKLVVFGFAGDLGEAALGVVDEDPIGAAFMEIDIPHWIGRKGQILRGAGPDVFGKVAKLGFGNQRPRASEVAAPVSR